LTSVKQVVVCHGNIELEGGEMRRLGVWLVLFAFARLSQAAVAGVDLHDYWDQRCKECHGHAGAFARRFLRVENGHLLGAHHQNDLDVFLRNHYLADALVAPVSAMLIAQVATSPLYGEKCARCHASAADFVRKSLVVKNGVLVGVSSARNVADYLASHGGLGPAEVRTMVETLTRVRNEVSDPPKSR